jgi:aspartyl-tRNA(Asn)/glutamyl-tRNA(Gln) amidotransferase subunit A
VEVTQAYLLRITELDPALRAFITVAAESALAQAQASAERWARGQSLGPLDGIPLALKDNMDVAGLPCTAGTQALAQRVPSQDATVWQRLAQAGAVLLGKLNMHEAALGATTDNAVFGRCMNPLREGHTPGGSSGGSAAAVAAHLCAAALGSDTMGSVRIPAAFCGNFGLKPSFGRVPAYPLSPMGTVAHLGPHTMSVRDAALMTNVLKQPDARDWTSLPPDASDYTVGLEDGIRGLRIAYSPTLGYAQNVHPEISAAVHAAVQQLQALGAHVEQIDPGFEDPLEITTGLWFLGAYTVWKGLSAEQQAVADPDFQAEAELGAQLSALQIQQLNQRRGVLGSHMRQFMQRFDLLVTPAVSIPAFEARAAGTVAMDPVSMLGWTPFSYPFNLTQQPAITVPCGLTMSGLPMGLQIVGPMFGDALVLRAARAYESVMPVARPFN